MILTKLHIYLTLHINEYQTFYPNVVLFCATWHRSHGQILTQEKGDVTGEPKYSQFNSCLAKQAQNTSIENQNSYQDISVNIINN